MSVSGKLLHRYGMQRRQHRTAAAKLDPTWQDTAAIELSTPGIVQLPMYTIVKGFNNVETFAIERLGPNEILLIYMTNDSRDECMMFCGYKDTVFEFYDGHFESHWCFDWWATVDIIIVTGSGSTSTANKIYKEMRKDADDMGGTQRFFIIKSGDGVGIAVSAEKCVYQLERPPPLQRVWPSAYTSLYSYGCLSRCDYCHAENFATLKDGTIWFDKVWIDLRTIRTMIHRKARGYNTREHIDKEAICLLFRLVPDRIYISENEASYCGPTHPFFAPEEFLILYEYTFTPGHTTTLPHMIRNKTAWDDARDTRVHRAKFVKPSPQWTLYWQPYVKTAVERSLAFCMGTHARLGADSTVRELPTDVAEAIWRLTANPTRY